LTIDKDELVEAILEAMDQRRKISNNEHADHHAFIKLLMEREERRVERMRKFQLSFIGAIAVGIVGALGFIGQFVFDYVLKNSSR